MLLVFFIYLAVMFVHAFKVYIKKQDKNLEDYLLAGRQVSPLATAFSAVNTGATGWVFTGWVAAGYLMGISALWYALTLPLMALLSYRFVAPLLRRQSQQVGGLTVDDFLAQRLGDPYHLIRIVGSLIIIILHLAYIGTNVVAAGITMEAAFKLNYVTAIAIVSFGMLLYCFLGGYRSVVWTDTFQGLIVLLALFFTPIVLLGHIGGWGALVTQLKDINPVLLTWTGGKTGYVLAMFVLGYFAIASSYFGFPGIVTRFMSIKSEKGLSAAMVINVFLETARMTCPVIIGLCLRVVLPTIGNPEQAFATWAVTYLNPVIAGIMMAAVLAAIMSSVDSFVMLITGAITQNIIRRIFVPDLPEGKDLAIGRVVTVGTVIIAFIIGAIKIKSILYFAMFAFGTLGMSFAASLLLTLYWRGTTHWGGLAGMVTGCLGSVGWMLYSPYYPAVREAFFAFPAALLATWLVSLATSKSLSVKRDVSVSAAD
jgi:sodium/proline symporter